MRCCLKKGLLADGVEFYKKSLTAAGGYGADSYGVVSDLKKGNTETYTVAAGKAVSFKDPDAAPGIRVGKVGGIGQRSRKASAQNALRDTMHRTVKICIYSTLESCHEACLLSADTIDYTTSVSDAQRGTGELGGAAVFLLDKQGNSDIMNRPYEGVASARVLPGAASQHTDRPVWLALICQTHV